MKETERLKLKLPEKEDFYNIEDMNENFTVLDEATVTQEDFGEFQDDISERLDSFGGVAGDIDRQLGEFKEEFEELKEAVVRETAGKFDELDARLFNEIHGYIDCVTTRNDDGSITEDSSIGTIITKKTETGYTETLTKLDGTVLIKITTKDDDKILEVVV